MTQRIKIAKIEVREGDKNGKHWRNFILTGEDGVKASTFDTTASKLKVGDTIEAVLEVKGSFTNIKSYEIVTPGAAPSKVEPPSPVEHVADRGWSIESQVAAYCCSELLAAKIITLESSLGKATVGWCLARLGGKPELMPERKVEPPPPTDRLEEDKPEVWKDKPAISAPTIVPDKSKSRPITKEGNPLLPDKAEDKAGEQAKCHVDLDWLKEQLNILQARKLKAWTNANLVGYLNNLTGKDGKTVSEAVGYLNKEQADAFAKKVQEALELS